MRLATLTKWLVRSSPTTGQPVGYVTDSSLRLAKGGDIDECAGTRPVCRANEICLNTIGNYSCVEPKCPEKYKYDKRTKSCRVLCRDIQLPCPHGAKYADSVRYMVVNLPPPIPGSPPRSGSSVTLRVVDSREVGLRLFPFIATSFSLYFA
ncbi:unnamed protein product [Protopolystoma xenopodis]|uniref:EGF-like calcium-binding domain-containing protein n=1 Tax=Protopolystoma xenopodis TaxID=117903 RepID=A0A448XJV8_9PLAT|nr:unnamed protein product [Protopolystoma xenopodis]